MQAIDFCFDFVSPYAYLAHEGLPDALRDISLDGRYRPVSLDVLQQAHGQQLLAAGAANQVLTYRHAQWLGHAQGVSLELPAGDPPADTPLLRLALAWACDGTISRDIASALFRHVWRGGLDANDPERLRALSQTAGLTGCRSRCHHPPPGRCGTGARSLA